MADTIVARDPQTHAIIGAAMAVHRELGPGFLEAVYAEAIHVELSDRSIPFSSEVLIPVHFKGRRLMTHYRADLICFEDVIVEIKALNSVGNNAAAQVLNYLKATGFERGLLLNFGERSLYYRRFVRCWGQSA